LLCAALATPLQVPAQSSSERSSPAVLKAFKSVVAKPSESTVRVLHDGREVGLGTIVAPDGWIVTKASLLSPSKVSVRLKNGKTFDAKLTGLEDKHDLAMLKIDAKGLSPIQWVSNATTPEPEEPPAPGDFVASPGIGDLPVAIGVVSVASRKPSPGELRLMSPDPNAGFLGVFIENGKGGPSVKVQPKGPAEKGGLKNFDIILTVNGAPVADSEALMSTIQKYKPSDVLTMNVKRGEEKVTLKVTLGRRPASMFDRSDKMNQMGSELSKRRGGFPVILQHDTVIKPGDCGGPLVNLDGKAIGINIARAGRTESYAIPAEAVLSLMSDLKSGKLAPREPTPEEKVAELNEIIKKSRTDLTEAEARLNKGKLAEKEARELKSKIRGLRERINDLGEELEALNDPTRKSEQKK